MKNMRKLYSCQNAPKDDETAPASLFTQPKSVEAHPNGGYLVNPITGDSISPIILDSGDTLVTGTAIPAKGKVINPDSVAKPQSFKVPPQSQLTLKKAHSNRYKVPENLTTIPVDPSLLKTVKLGEGNPDFILTNSIGDTIKTGVPIPTKGKTVKVIQPKSTPALAPVYKDAAIPNLLYLDVDQGMNSSFVKSILEDKKGNLWLGTSGGGITKYDGESFTHYTEKEGLSNKLVFSIIEDKSGNIWFGFWGGGVCKFDGETFTHYTEKEGLSNNNVRWILEDKNGNIWFGTNKGLSKLVLSDGGDTITHYTQREGLSHNIVTTILEDKNGNIWFGTLGGGVNKYNPETSAGARGGTFTHYTQKDGLSYNRVWSILEDKNGNIWIGTGGGGVCKFEPESDVEAGGSFTIYTEKEGLSNNFVLSILEDKNGNIWFGTAGGGVCKYEPEISVGTSGETFTHFTENEGLSYNSVESIFEDKKGNIWIGTSGGGLCKYEPEISVGTSGETFTHFTEKEGLINTQVHAISEDKNGNIWFGTYRGLSKYDGETFTHYTQKEGLSNNSVLSMLEDKKGNIWFGTYGGGVSKYNPGASIEAEEATFTHYTEIEGLSNNFVFSILEDKNGNIWFGTGGGGLNKYDGKTFTHYTQKEGLSNNVVLSILEDQKGNIWFGTAGGGVTKYDGKTFIHYTEKEGLSNNQVLSIFENQNGDIWFGTSNGVSKLHLSNDIETFTYYTEKEGLSNNEVRSILEDYMGRVWISTTGGLTLLNTKPASQKTSDIKTSQISLYGLLEGGSLKGLDFSLNSAYIDSKNRAWWGRGKSLVMLDLNTFKISETPPSIRLTQLQINEQIIDYRNIEDDLAQGIAFSGVERFENYPLDLSIPYDKNHLTFLFVGIDWSAPHKIKYSYRMLGLNAKWSVPSKEAKAEYRSLPYGSYTFQIRAIGESQEWSNSFNYSFTIRPPWWHTWWARVIYFVLALALILGYTRWRTATLNLRKKQLENEINLATKEISAKKAEVERQRDQIEKEKDRSDSLLLNILPAEIAEELKQKGRADARDFDMVSILFTDFKGFTEKSEKLSAAELVNEINVCFEAFDAIMEKYGIEKIKTIGDAYMAAGGLPVPAADSVKNTVLAALEMQKFILSRKATKGEQAFEMRVGIHTGPVVAGIVGVKKFQYDIWGDTVNTAARMEQNSEVGKVNISQATYELLKDDPQFTFENRGKIEAKGKGEVEMYFVTFNQII